MLTIYWKKNCQTLAYNTCEDKNMTYLISDNFISDALPCAGKVTARSPRPLALRMAFSWWEGALRAFFSDKATIIFFTVFLLLCPNKYRHNCTYKHAMKLRSKSTNIIMPHHSHKSICPYCKKFLISAADFSQYITMLNFEYLLCLILPRRKKKSMLPMGAY